MEYFRRLDIFLNSRASIRGARLLVLSISYLVGIILVLPMPGRVVVPAMSRTRNDADSAIVSEYVNPNSNSYEIQYISIVT